MSLDKRIRNLESVNVSAWRPVSDDLVLEAIRQGMANDRHVAWLDGLFRPAIVSKLCLAGAVLREPKYAEAIDTSAWTLAAHLGMLTMAQPADEGVPQWIEAKLSSGPFITSIPDPDEAERVHRAGPDPRLSSVLWIRSQLVGRALGLDLGRGFRAGLDDAHASGDFARLPVDLRCPHPALHERLLVANEALALPGDGPLLIDDESWRGIDDLVRRRGTG